MADQDKTIHPRKKKLTEGQRSALKRRGGKASVKKSGGISWPDRTPSKWVPDHEYYDK